MAVAGDQKRTSVKGVSMIIWLDDYKSNYSTDGIGRKGCCTSMICKHAGSYWWENMWSDTTSIALPARTTLILTVVGFTAFKLISKAAVCHSEIKSYNDSAFFFSKFKLSFFFPSYQSYSNLNKTEENLDNLHPCTELRKKKNAHIILSVIQEQEGHLYF